MTKAFITIEVDIDTHHFPVQTGLGDSSNPERPPRSRIIEGKRDFIWEVACEWLIDKQGFVQIKEVRFPKGVEL
jgi:hypothetical protein